MDYSPILSIITATLETGAAIWAFFARGRRSVRFSAGALLLLLAAYQVIEAVLCHDPARFTTLTRVAFMVVLWLPATGLLLITYLAPILRRFLRIYTTLFYLVALGLFIWMLIDKTPVGTSVCIVVFARFNGDMPYVLTWVYGVYYQLGLLNMLLISAIAVIKTSDAITREQIGQLLYGCLAFIVPAMMFVLLFPIADGAYASILCHFALFLAIFIFRILWLENKNAKGNFDLRNN